MQARVFVAVQEAIRQEVQQLVLCVPRVNIHRLDPQVVLAVVLEHINPVLVEFLV